MTDATTLITYTVTFADVGGGDWGRRITVRAADMDAALDAGEAKAREMLSASGMSAAYSCDADEPATEADVIVFVEDEDDDEGEIASRRVTCALGA